MNANRDIVIVDDDGVEIAQIHGCEGEADEQITIDEIKACSKYFGTMIQQFWPHKLFNMAFYLALHKEAEQRGGKLEVNTLDAIPIMSKWIEKDAFNYIHKEAMACIEDILK